MYWLSFIFIQIMFILVTRLTRSHYSHITKTHNKFNLKFVLVCMLVCNLYLDSIFEWMLTLVSSPCITLNILLAQNGEFIPSFVPNSNRALFWNRTFILKKEKQNQFSVQLERKWVSNNNILDFIMFDNFIESHER